MRQRSAPAGLARGSALVLLAVLGAAAYSGYAYWQLKVGESTAPAGAIITEVVLEDFELAITERGEIESAGDIEVRSEVVTRNQPGLAILRVVPEGTVVKDGDFLVELDSSALRDERTLQQINVNTAEAAVVEARNVYETAVIAKREYLEGTFVQEVETLESELFVAEENLSRAEEYLKYSKLLAAKGYVNDLQLQADRFAVEKARKEADAATTKLGVLKRFTREKMLKQLESDILIAKAKWEAEKNSLSLEEGKLAELDDQIAKCEILSPGSGVVKYAHEIDRRGDADFLVEEGALIRERQVILRLPDPSQMRVEVKINESLIQHVKPGMPAAIEPIGADGVVLAGTVEFVNQYAEPSGWRKANVKEYKAFVRVNEGTSILRSGMTASVTIRSMHMPSVLQVPIQAVYPHESGDYCLVQGEDGALQARPVECGPTNDRFFVIKTGLEQEERVVVNPRAVVDSVEMPAAAAVRPAADTPRGLDPTDQPAREKEEPRKSGSRVASRSFRGTVR
ncbi:MAG: HlyD family efflux transporter periplasmic adaptor subunit [Planctomycetota bacterium]